MLLLHILYKYMQMLLFILELKKDKLEDGGGNVG